MGTQGVPARYGSFETLVENIIGKNCPLEVQYTVFCSSKDFKKEERLLSYKGALLKYIRYTQMVSEYSVRYLVFVESGARI